MKSIYDYRSAIVHGENQSKLDKKRYLSNLNEEAKLVVEVAESYLKECIKVLIHKPKFLKAKNIDEELILGNSEEYREKED
ncbi:hypothetical protein [Brevibacillus laterosporus]|uniref:hypothetical protein n=1 Tax=Brevibacillus laterosporus TaxID=1465 RepID=UPI00215C3AAE|nr:hypothetical protein [Brevibacillus laterosporus]MCR8996264.1 hypothetical protein [Brevibacillus laterosporus]